MKILTVNINKGGTGKTTFAYHFAEYLATKGHRVLLMDLDDSGNLTGRYRESLREEETIVALFEERQVVPCPIKSCLDLVGSGHFVESLKERQVSKRRREYTIGKWLAMNYETLSSKYDYIVIDTENDEGILTTNALIVSDVIIGIAEPSKDGVTALGALRRFVTDLNNDFDVQGRLFYIANRINRSEKSSLELLEVLGQRPEFLGYLPSRTVFKDEVTIFDNPKSSSQLIEQVTTLFQTIQVELDREVG